MTALHDVHDVHGFTPHADALALMEADPDQCVVIGRAKVDIGLGGIPSDRVHLVCAIDRDTPPDRVRAALLDFMAAVTHHLERRVPARAPYPALEPIDDTIPDAARAAAAELLECYRPDWPPTHPYPGRDAARRALGMPGHCNTCAVVGHVIAHPNLGCADVDCTGSHPSEATR